LASADWQRKREIIRTLVQRIDIDKEVIKIIFRVTTAERFATTVTISLTDPMFIVK